MHLITDEYVAYGTEPNRKLTKKIKHKPLRYGTNYNLQFDNKVLMMMISINFTVNVYYIVLLCVFGSRCSG